MDRECPSDRQSDADRGNTKRRKARVAEEALRTLSDLNKSIKELKSWERERSLLTQQIEVQIAKIGDLEVTNASLKNQLRATEQDSLLPQLPDCDRKIDTAIVNYIKKIITTLENQSRELTRIHQSLSASRAKNRRLRTESRGLRTLIEASEGSYKNFYSKARYLKDVSRCLDREIDEMKRSFEEDKEPKDEEERVSRVRVLMTRLESKLKKDRSWLLAAGNPHWSWYLRRVERLESSSRELLGQLARTRLHSGGFSSEGDAARVEELAKRVRSRLESLRSEPMKIARRLGARSRRGYSRRVGTIEKAVASARSVIDKLIIEWEERRLGERNLQEADGALGKKLASGIEALEIALRSSSSEFLLSGDRTKLIQKIRRLENSVRGVKKETRRREEEREEIELELTGAKIAFREKSEELEKLRMKYEKAVCGAVKNRGGLEDQRKENREESFRVIVENLRRERESLVEEIERFRGVVGEREERIARISGERERLEERLKKEEIEREKMSIIEEQRVRDLKNEILQLNLEIESMRDKIGGMNEETMKSELNRLEMELGETRQHLEDKVVECSTLKNKGNEVKSEKIKLEKELARVRIQNEALIDRLNSERILSARTLKDNQRLSTDLDLKDNEIRLLNSEKETLRKNFEDSNLEREALKNELEELQQESFDLREGSLELKVKLSEMSRQLNILEIQKGEVEMGLKKIEEKEKKLNIDLENLKRENGRLSEELEVTKSDKLSLTKNLSDWKTRWEETSGLLERKVEESKRLEEDSKRVLWDLEAANLKVSKLTSEIEELMQCKEKLKVELDTSNKNRKILEENLREAKNANQESRESVEKHRKKCEDLESEREALKVELSRLRAKNSELKCESRIKENDRLVEENEGLKRELANLREAISRARGEVEEAEVERKRMRREVEEEREEKQAMRTLLERVKEEARGEIITRDETIEGLERKNVELENTIREQESKEKRVEDEEVNSRARRAREALENELEAVRRELCEKRVENSLWKSRYEAEIGKSSRLQSEKCGLEEKLEGMRLSRNLEEEGEVRRLRAECEKLGLHKLALENRLTEALEEIGKYSVASSRLNGLEEKLRVVLKDYEATRRMLGSASEEIDGLRRGLCQGSTNSEKWIRDKEKKRGRGGVKNSDRI